MRDAGAIFALVIGMDKVLCRAVGLGHPVVVAHML